MTFLQLPENEKIELINQMHEETKLPQVIIEFNQSLHTVACLSQ
jgi:hypothetical protein